MTPPKTKHAGQGAFNVEGASNLLLVNKVLSSSNDQIELIYSVGWQCIAAIVGFHL